MGNSLEERPWVVGYGMMHLETVLGELSVIHEQPVELSLDTAFSGANEDILVELLRITVESLDF